MRQTAQVLAMHISTRDRESEALRSYFVLEWHQPTISPPDSQRRLCATNLSVVSTDLHGLVVRCHSTREHRLSQRDNSGYTSARVPGYTSPRANPLCPSALAPLRQATRRIGLNNQARIQEPTASRVSVPLVVTRLMFHSRRNAACDALSRAALRRLS